LTEHSTYFHQVTLSHWVCAFSRLFFWSASSGIANILVDEHPDYDSKCFIVERTDGTKVDFSYLKTLNTIFPDEAGRKRGFGGGDRGDGFNKRGRGGRGGGFGGGRGGRG
jgi:uncharacterized membrane protein YgcG